MLGGAGLLDEAHAAVDLHAERGDLDADVGATRPWRSGSAGRRARWPRVAGVSPVALRESMRRRRRSRQIARAASVLRPHRQQHAAHVGVADDRHRSPLARRPMRVPCTRSRA